MAFDSQAPLSEHDVEAILESARWAPTAFGAQDFEIVVVDRQETLREMGRVDVARTAPLWREHTAPISWGEGQLLARGTGLLASMFPPAWWPDGGGPGGQPLGTGHPADAASGADPGEPGTMPVARGELEPASSTMLVVLHGAPRRAPESEADFFGVLSLGCVLDSMWLTATSLGIGMQIMNVSSAPHVERGIRELLGVPERLRIAFACRLGYPATVSEEPPRVRPPVERVVHRNRYRQPTAPPPRPRGRDKGARPDRGTAGTDALLL